jgi:hypothetical protein
VVAGREWPSTLRDVAEVYIGLRGIFTDLGDVDVVEGLLDGVAELLTDAALTKSLESEGSIPKLKTVVSLNLHSVSSKPEVVEKTLLMLSEGLGLAIGGIVLAKHIHRLVDGSNVDVMSLLVLIANVIESRGEGLLSEPRQSALVVEIHQWEGSLNDRGVRVVEINLGNIKALVLPNDVLVGLNIELLAKLLNERCDLSGTFASVDISHRQVNNSAVAPEAARVEGGRERQQPKLRQNGVDSIPLIDAKCSKPELTPVRDSSGTTKFMNTGAGASATSVAGRKAQQTKRNIVESIGG